MAKQFNEKQLAFIEFYLIYRNASRAALEAGYSPKTAYSQGHRLVNNAEIFKEINRRDKEMLKKMNITKEGLIKELEMIKNIALTKGKTNSFLEALREQAKLLGLYEPEKLQIDSIIKLNWNDDEEGD